MATHQTDAPVEEFLAQVPDDQRREDARRLCVMMQEITGEPPVMWGSSIVGFGAYHYRYASGHEGDSALAKHSHLAAAPHLPAGLTSTWSATASTQYRHQTSGSLAQSLTGSRTRIRPEGSLLHLTAPIGSTGRPRRCCLGELDIEPLTESLDPAQTASTALRQLARMPCRVSSARQTRG